ncbi:uncharacterized protein LOC114179879 [Vigna unguiculata]|uniref:RING-type domain-containing protein n=1 Tax=Vigna unguiculata TaxID=3917 RepID=A0A4D6KV20_VIGUN|nr:uncharacterized protein LOC114179879 [Vigna unguiculata]XP_027922168.1 uncharacterized protein LOC114179879 [Vigna unguiculata]QCD80590.1 hypothetical protein DEO72_LG2g912 [Vigna unguiculata]
MELLSNELSHSDDHGLLHLPPALDIADRSVKLLNTHPTMTNHHHGLGRSIFLKQTRHYYGHQYFRRNSTNHANASSSRAKEYREKVFSRPERIPSSSLGMEEMSSNNKAEMVCGICEKLLSQKINFLGNSISSSELSVVAVLVCGHVYHANCLEQRTRFEDVRDPPCPVCAGLLLQDHHNDSSKIM